MNPPSVPPGGSVHRPPGAGSGHTPGAGGIGGVDTLDAPTNVVGRIVGSSNGYVSILLSWTYQDVGAKLFQVDRSTNPDSHVSVAKVDYTGADRYEYLDRGLPQGPTYHYWVKAMNGFNHSPWSEMFVVPT
jgi:hypothetical protein